MALVPAHEILADATSRNYGVPCLLAGSLEMLIAQVTAAEEIRAPLILAYNSAVTPRIPMNIAFPAMVTAANSVDVPVATILDHGDSLAGVMTALDQGSSSVMIDGSALPYEENVKLTAEVVLVAHERGVSVEGELGAVGGSSVELGRDSDIASSKTNPQLAADFVERTGVDVLAISFGNSHGIYRGTPALDLLLVQEIAGLVDVPLAMHGASGLTFEQYGPIIDSGISKINYYTAMARQISYDLRAWISDADDEELVYHHVSHEILDRFEHHTIHLLQVLRGAGKADGYHYRSD